VIKNLLAGLGGDCIKGQLLAGGCSQLKLIMGDANTVLKTVLKSNLATVRSD
jgi:hypothetical protein